MEIYLDSNNIVHKDFMEGYTEAEHSFFDSVPSLAFDCYKYIPEKNFIQCVDSAKADAILQQYAESEKRYNDVLNTIATKLGVITRSEKHDE